MTEPIAPILNDLWRPFWEAASEGQLVLPFCTTSERPFWPPAPASPFASGGAVEWRAVAAEGRLLSRIVYRRGFQQALADRLPYAVGLVELPWGVRLCVHIPDADADGAALPGDRVEIGFGPLAAGEQPVPVVAAPARPNQQEQ